ncbi:MAG: MFS transporter [Petrotogales bacterium]
MRKLNKIAYGYGDLGLSISWTIVGFYFMYYLTDVALINPAWVGGAILVGRLWDAFSDPIFGRFSDRTSTRFGRRRPFILGAAIPYGLSFFLLWIVPDTTPTIKLIYVVFFFLFHTTASTAYSVPYTALTPELAKTYDDRTSLNAYRMFFSILGGLIAGAVPAFIVQMIGNESKGYAFMGLLFGLFIITSPIIVFLFTKESTEKHLSKKKLFEALKDIIQNKPFIYAVLMFFFTWTGVNVVSATIIYFATYVMDRKNEIGILIGLLFLSSIAFLPLWVKISGKLEKRRAYQVGMLELICCLLLIAFFGDILNDVWLYVMVIITGFGVSAAHILPFSILPDAVEYDRVISGEKREGMYYGLSTFFQKLGTSLMLFVVGVSLELAGYVPNIPQEPHVLLTIRILFGVFPAALFLTGIILMIPYPIDRNFQKNMFKGNEKSHEDI